MKIRDVITEASVVSKPEKYVPGYKLRLAVSSKQGKIIYELLAAQLRDLRPEEILTIADINSQATVSADLPGRGGVVIKLKRANGQILQIVGSKGAIETGLNDAGSAEREDTKVNLGDIAEGILGAATFAKLIKRSGGAIDTIDANDVFSIFDSLKPATSTDELDDWYAEVPDVGGAVKDKIWFRCKIKAAAKFAIHDPKLRAKITPMATGAASFMNSQYGQRYAEYWYTNQKPDEIGVISDGLSAQSEQKTDVFMVTKTPEGTMSKQRLPISLKAGAAQFAQESGVTADKMVNLFGSLGVDFPQDMLVNYEKAGKTATLDTQLANVAPLYKYASAELDAKLSKLSTRGEMSFITQLANQIEQWATLGSGNVRLVNFKGKKFEVLSFQNLASKLQNTTFSAVYSFEANPKIQIVAHNDKTGKDEVLIQIRTYLNDKGQGKFYQRNIIEKGPYLSEVAKVQKLD